MSDSWRHPVRVEDRASKVDKIRSQSALVESEFDSEVVDYRECGRNGWCVCLGLDCSAGGFECSGGAFDA